MQQAYTAKFNKRRVSDKRRVSNKRRGFWSIVWINAGAFIPGFTVITKFTKFGGM